MAKKYTVQREEVVEAARSLLGVPFVHQGRDARLGVDCVGLLVVIGQTINYPRIVDAPNYKRTPSAAVLESVLLDNADEIPLEAASLGDFILMRMGGRKPRHVAVITNLQTDAVRGVEPTILHALCSGAIRRVVEQPVRQWETEFVKAYRIRGLID